MNDLRIPPSNHLELLKGDREAQCSIRVSKQYRLCFHFIGGNAFNVEKDRLSLRMGDIWMTSALT